MEEKYISAKSLYRKVLDSACDNPHTDEVYKACHTEEHIHFMKMIEEEPSVSVAQAGCGLWIECEGPDKLKEDV